MVDTTQSHEWLTAHGDYLYRFALARLRDAHQAEDMVQETLLAAMQSQSFAGQSNVRTWLTGILKHKIVDLMRQNSREIVTDHTLDMQLPELEDIFDESGNWADKPQSWYVPDDDVQQQQFLAVLQRCLDSLPSKLASLFMLREVYEEDNEKICKDLEITSTNAWVMLHRARLGLRKCVELHWLT